ncbi:MAG: glycoside hydrolase family 13 protein [Patescibacteria group bacterium]
MHRFKKQFRIFLADDPGEVEICVKPALGRFFTRPCRRIHPGLYEAEIEAPPGDVFYFFRDRRRPDGIILDPFNLQEGAKGLQSVCRIGTPPVLPVSFTNGYPHVDRQPGGEVEIKLIAYDPWIREVELCTPAGGYAMETVFTVNAKKYYKLMIAAAKLEHGYNFALKGDRTYYLGNEHHLRDDGREYFTLPEEDEAMPPDGSRIVYAIFVDSFKKGGPGGEEEARAWTASNPPHVFRGGNLAGVAEKISHLARLGVDTVYLTPIHPAASNHRYDHRSLLEIDPLLGREEDLAGLVEACHARGIRLVLDLVANHCGTGFFAFRDLIKNQERSAYRDWFIVDKYPVDPQSGEESYSSWWGHAGMPQFNLDHQEVRAYIIGACRRWLTEFHVDGFRVDVASELGKDFLSALLAELRGIKDDGLFILETWDSAQSILARSRCTGITNYLYWAGAYEPFFGGRMKKVTGLADAIMEAYFQFSHRRALRNWNIMGSHDTARFASVIEDRRELYNAAILHYFLPGAATIYYGDELGMEGPDDPGNRTGMRWDQAAGNDLLSWYERLGAIRRHEEILQHGHLKIAAADDARGIMILCRTLGEQSIYLALNFSPRRQTCRIETRYGLFDLLTGERTSPFLSVGGHMSRLVKEIP